jgi:hypothetical protein
MFFARRLPDDIVPAWENFLDKPLPIPFPLNPNLVTYGYRVGEGNIVQTKFAYNSALKQFSGVVQPDTIPAAGRFNYGSCLHSTAKLGKATGSSIKRTKV